MADEPENEVPPADLLIACLGRLAEGFGVAVAPSMFSSLARDSSGRLPLHQAEPALELLGLNCDASRPNKLPRKSSAYPAIVAFDGGFVALVHEIRGGDARVWRPGEGEASWESFDQLAQTYAGWIATVFGDASAMREAGAPWDVKAKGHWFWSELYKLRKEFWPSSSHP
jgi:ATP-binding cassette subfamily C protein LapB